MTTETSPALNILNSALAQVDEVLTKAETTIQLLQNNLQQTNAQKIGLSHSKGMLTELIERIKKAEVVKNQLPVPAAHPQVPLSTPTSYYTDSDNK